MGNPRADFKDGNTSSETYLTWGIMGTFQPILNMTWQLFSHQTPFYVTIYPSRKSKSGSLKIALKLASQQ